MWHLGTSNVRNLGPSTGGPTVASLARLALAAVLVAAFMFAPTENTAHADVGVPDPWCTNAWDCISLPLERPRSEFWYPVGEDPSNFRRDNYLPKGTLFYPSDNGPMPDFAVQFQNPNPSPTPGSPQDWDVRFFRVNVGGCRTHHRFADLQECSWRMIHTLNTEPDLVNAYGRVADLDPRRCNRFRLYSGTWTSDTNYDPPRMVFSPEKLEAETVIQLDPEFIVAPIIAHLFCHDDANCPANGNFVNEYADDQALKNFFDKTYELQPQLEFLAQLPGTHPWNFALAASPMDDVFSQCGVGMRLVEVRHHTVTDESLIYNVDITSSPAICGVPNVHGRYLAKGFQSTADNAFHIYFVGSNNKPGTWASTCNYAGKANAIMPNDPAIAGTTGIAHEIGGHGVLNLDHNPSDQSRLMYVSGPGNGVIIPPSQCCKGRTGWCWWGPSAEPNSCKNDVGLFGSRLIPDQSQLSAVISLEDGVEGDPDGTGTFDQCNLRAANGDLHPWEGLYPPTDPLLPDNEDSDGDGIPDRCDNCQDDANSGQELCLRVDFGNESGMACDDDLDDDCLTPADDNCPDVPNADQVDCDGNGMGDACDTKLCPHLPRTDVLRECGHDNGVYWCRDTGEHKVSYRLVGYQPGQPTRVEDLEARYCSCRDENGASVWNCNQTVCRQVGERNGNPLDDTGWLPLNWQAWHESGGGTGEIQCGLTDVDGNGTANECPDPLPDRVYHRLYYDDQGSTGLGSTPGDSEAYWFGPNTKSFRWRWEAEEWPHPPGTEWDWPPGNHTMSSYLWLHPGVPETELPYTTSNAYSEKLFLTKIRYYPEPYQGNLHLEIGQIIRTGPMGREAQTPAILLHELSMARSVEDLGKYRYVNPRDAASLAGIQVALLDPADGLVQLAVPSQAAPGSAPLDVTGYALCGVTVPGPTNETGQPGSRVYAYGGEDRFGGPVDILWRGIFGRDGSFTWEEVALTDRRPDARLGAGLFWSARRKSLLLVGGVGAKRGGLKPYLVSPDKGTTTMARLSGAPLGQRSHFGFSQSGDVAVLYGGRNPGGAALGDLYAIDLERLHVSHLDWPSKQGPGPRVGAAVDFQLVRRTVVLFGGEDAEGRLRSDVWELDLRTAQWRLVRDDCAEGCCPPGMKHGAVVSSPLDGTLRITTGIQTRSEAEESLWSLEPFGWTSYHELTGQGQPQSCKQGEDPGDPGCGGGCASGGEERGGLLLLLFFAIMIFRRKRG